MVLRICLRKNCKRNSRFKPLKIFTCEKIRPLEAALVLFISEKIRIGCWNDIFSFSGEMQDVIRLQELRAEELKMLVETQNNQIQLLQSLVKVLIESTLFKNYYD